MLNLSEKCHSNILRTAETQCADHIIFTFSRLLDNSFHCRWFIIIDIKDHLQLRLNQLRQSIHSPDLCGNNLIKLAY